jgi:uncharacterized repeat protein (TIGR01451 family)
VTANDGNGLAGYYLFTGIPPGDYIVDFVRPAGYVFTIYNADSLGLNGEANSDAQIPSGRTVAFSLLAGESNLDVDAGLVLESSIGNFVWFDVNGDGLQNLGEPGVGGVVVNLLDSSGNPVLDANTNAITTVTAANGSYLFDGLYSGNYIVEFVLPGNTSFTVQNADSQGTLGATNSDANVTTGRTPVFALAAAEQVTAIDAGLLRADLAVFKSVSQPTAIEGSTVFFTIVVSNLGPTRTTGVQITDPVPSGLTYVGSTASQGSYNNGTTIWTIGTLAAGANATLELEVTVNTGTLNSTKTNTASISASDVPDPVSTNNQDSALVYISGLNLTKTSDATGTVLPGDTITYTLVISNASLTALTNVVVTDNIPTGATYVSGSVTGFFTPTIPPVTNVVVINVNSNFVIPIGVTSLTVQAWGGGGGGRGDNSTDDRAAGGGGGAYASSTLTVTSGVSYSVVVGAGGGNGNASTNGGSSQFGNLVVAAGGSGTSNNNGGPGGTVAASTGTVRFAGGAGGNRGPNNGGGGGGGGSAFATSNGLNGVNGAAVNGGAGGAGTGSGGSGGSNGNDGSPGNAPGGGGGGCGDGANNQGGDGASGRVIVTYVQSFAFVPVAPPNLATGVTLAAGSTLTITFDVTVNTPAQVAEVCNTASANSAQTLTPSVATVCDPIDPSALAIVGNRVWLDVDGDGIQDIGETNNIAGVPVYLFDTQTNLIATTTTDSSGIYSFTNVVPGTYVIGFDFTNTTTDNLTISPANQGGDEALDSDGITGNIGGVVLTGPITLVAGQVNNDVDQGITYLISTRAEVAEVWGEARDDGPYVVWSTSSEWGTAGFVVYRIDLERRIVTRLNDLLIPSAFQPTGSTYAWRDEEADVDSSVTYRLEEFEVSGSILDLGTHTVTFELPRARSKTERSGAMKKQTALAQPVPYDLPETSECLKMLVREEGIYAVSLSDVAAITGLDVEAVRVMAAGTQWNLTSLGQPVPYLYQPVEDRLVFFAQATTNWYTRDAAYMMCPGEGLAMNRREPGTTGGIGLRSIGHRGYDQLAVTLRFEQDRLPMDHLLYRPDDFFYWDYVISGNAVTGTRHFPIDLTGHVGEPVELSVRLIGWSKTSATNDHKAEVSLNGTLVATETFDDQDVHLLSVTIPPETVVDGVNTVSVKGVLQPGSSYSFFVVDWIEAEFVRRLIPATASVQGRSGALSAVWATQFTNPLAMSIQSPDLPVLIADTPDGEIINRLWTTATFDERFAVVESDDIPALVPVPATADAWFTDSENRIDYLIIVSRAMAAAVQPLADYRSAQGLRVGVAVFEDVCDVMMHGLRTPEAIPALLDFARTNWREAPWLVMLAGNGHYDYLNALSSEVNHIPPLLHLTQRGLFAADGLMTDLDLTGVPSIALGRLPARNAAELSSMIAKIIAHEEAFDQPWQQQIVLAADQADSGGDFPVASEKLADLAEPDLAVNRVYMNELPVTNARTQLVGHFYSGAGVIHYTGHGGQNNFSAENLLRAVDVNALTNTNQPLVVALSCLVGRFEAPGVDSLGELFMRRSAGGAVAVWGPSGLSHNDPAVELAQAFYRSLLDEGAGALGPAVLSAQQTVHDQLSGDDTFVMYNLLGDPALRLGGAPMGGGLRDRGFAQWRWSRFSPDELTNAAISGATGSADIFGMANFIYYALGGEPGQATLPVGLRVVGWDADGGLVLTWKRRIVQDDVDYHIGVTEDLVESGWEINPGDVQTISVEPDPDGTMETVRASIHRSSAERLFIVLRFTQEEVP